MPSCHFVPDLGLAVQDLCAHLPQDNIRCLINSMPDRVAACIAAGGGPTGMGHNRATLLSENTGGPQRLWDQYQSEDSVSRRPVPGRSRATTPAEDRFLALSARRRRTTTVPQLVADHFQASGKRISATTVRNRLHNAGLYARRPVVCVPLNGRQRRNRLCWAREHVSWTQQQWASVLFTDDYRGGGILVWAGISLGGHTDLHVFHGGTVTGLRYRDEILDPYVRPYAAAIGNDFILMDDNARPHRARIVEGVSGGSRFGTNGMASSISRPESDRTSLGLSWQLLL
ncbi:transposable element Tcb2 transposase [Trichonephila clavipes]|nr:transposable element Tcb2 transposase [Trichonephila clavipes]